jgi:HSP20 family protein
MSAFVLHRNPAAVSLSNWVDSFLGDLLSETATATATATAKGPAGTFQPRMDVAETEDGYFVTMDIPGLTKDDISVKVEGGAVTIEGERKEEKRGRYHRSELAYGRFVKDFTLPDDVDAEKIEAKVNNGVLELRLPKSEKARAVEIKVS